MSRMAMPPFRSGKRKIKVAQRLSIGSQGIAYIEMNRLQAAFPARL